MNINFEAEILPGHSIGNICLGMHYEDVLAHLAEKDYSTSERDFANAGTKFFEITIDDGTLVAIANEQGSIVRLQCGTRYAGKLRSVFFAGMSVRNILKQSSKQLMLHGLLVLDGEYGAAYGVPSEFSELDYAKELPSELRLDEINVMSTDWWH